MIYYLSLCLIYFVVSFQEFREVLPRKKHKQLCLWLLAPLFFMTAFRSNVVGNDTLVYMNAFNNISGCSSMLNAFRYSRMETGYVLLNYVCAKLGLSFLGMQIIISAFIYYSIYHMLYTYSPNAGLSCLILLTMRMSFGPMNTIRMWIAISIVLFSIPCIINKKIISFLLIIMLAASFHTSVIVFLVLYPLYFWRSNILKPILIIATSIIISIMGVLFFEKLTLFLGIYQGYLSSAYFVYDTNIAIYFVFAMDVCLVILSYYTKRLNYAGYILQTGEVNRYYSHDISLEKLWSLMLLIVLAIDIIGLSNTIMGRISGFFNVAFIVTVPGSLKSIKSERNRLLLYFIISMFLVLQFIIVLIYRSSWDGVLPFKWAFGQ